MKTRTRAPYRGSSVEGSAARRRLWTDGRPPVRITITLPSALADRIDGLADDRGLAASKIIRALIEESLDRAKSV